MPDRAIQIALLVMKSFYPEKIRCDRYLSVMNRFVFVFVPNYILLIIIANILFFRNMLKW